MRVYLHSWGSSGLPECAVLTLHSRSSTLTPNQSRGLRWLVRDGQRLLTNTISWYLMTPAFTSSQLVSLLDTEGLTIHSHQLDSIVDLNRRDYIIVME